MATVQELLGDFTAAIDRLRQASNQDEQRRSLNEAMNCMYTLRSHFEGSDKAGYRQAASSLNGRVTEGLSLLRGKMVHRLVSDLGPEIKPLSTSEHLYPSEDLRPGSNLSWLTGDEAQAEQADMLKDVRFPDYDSTVGGLPVLQSLRQAQDFFEGLASAG